MEGFCNLGLLYGGLWIEILQFFIKKYFSSCKTLQFLVIKSLDMDPESGSALKQMQIHNTESGVQNSKYIESQNFESMFLDVHSVHSD